MAAVVFFESDAGQLVDAQLFVGLLDFSRVVLKLDIERALVEIRNGALLHLVLTTRSSLALGAEHNVGVQVHYHLSYGTQGLEIKLVLLLQIGDHSFDVAQFLADVQLGSLNLFDLLLVLLQGSVVLLARSLDLA